MPTTETRSIDHRLQRLTPEWAKHFLRRLKPAAELQCYANRRCERAVNWVWSYATIRGRKAVRCTRLLCDEHAATKRVQHKVPWE